MIDAGRSDLREELKAMRLAAGISVGEAAARLGVDYTTIWRWESGRTAIKPRDEIAMREAYAGPRPPIALVRDSVDDRAIARQQRARTFRNAMQRAQASDEDDEVLEARIAAYVELQAETPGLTEDEKDYEFECYLSDVLTPLIARRLGRRRGGPET